MGMPSWLKNAIFYEIYPQSFLDTNSDGIGDLEGIIRKLDYIQELGCNALWINPCFDSPFYDAGYDVRDYKKIAPRYGTNEDMRRLLREAHTRGIRVLLDLVPGHTSIDHDWFLRSMRKEPEFESRYIWTESPWDTIEEVFGITGTITGFCQRGNCAVDYFSIQPALNYGYRNPDPQKPWQLSIDAPAAVATREAIYDVIRFWLSMGCDGFRVDMPGHIVKGDDDRSAAILVWQKILGRLKKEFPEAAMISEWGDPERALKAGFHMDFLLQFGPSRYMDLFRDTPYFSRKGGGDISGFVKFYEQTLKASDGLICIPSGNHDTPRIARCLDDGELRLAFAFLLSMPGAPFIYYGDEIGMRYLEDLTSVEGGYFRTGSRSPMQWDETLNAGFSSANPQNLYTPLDPAPDRPNVLTQMADPGSLWHEVRALIDLRLTHEALQSEAPIEFMAYGSDAMLYRRGAGNGSVLVALNPSSQKSEMTIDGLNGMSIIYRIGNASVADGDMLTLAPGSGVFLKKS